MYPTEIKTFGGVEDRQGALSSKGWLGRAWAQNYTVTTRLPLHPSLGAPNTDYAPPAPFTSTSRHLNDSHVSHAALSFVHGGLAPDFPYLTPYPSHINNIGRSLLHKLQNRPQPPPSPPNPYPGLPASATAAEQNLYAGDGPLWYRGWALEDEAVACEKVDEVLERTGTKRLIMGHTPTFTVGRLIPLIFKKYSHIPSEYRFKMRRQSDHYRHRYEKKAPSARKTIHIFTILRRKYRNLACIRGRTFRLVHHVFATSTRCQRKASDKT